MGRTVSGTAKTLGELRLKGCQRSASRSRAIARIPLGMVLVGYGEARQTPVISQRRIEASEGKRVEIGRKYYRPFSRRSLSGVAFRGMTGRTVNPQVPGSSPGRGANNQQVRSFRTDGLCSAFRKRGMHAACHPVCSVPRNNIEAEARPRSAQGARAWRGCCHAFGFVLCRARPAVLGSVNAKPTPYLVMQSATSRLVSV